MYNSKCSLKLKVLDFSLSIKILSLLLLLAVALILFSQGVQAFAQPELMQTENAGELVSVPTANILQDRGRIGAEYIGDETRIFGAFRVENFLEIGGQVKEEDLGVLLKTRILEEESDLPSLAVGIRHTSPYFVASKYLDRNTNLHFGIGDSNPEGLYIAINTIFNPGIQGIAYVADEKEEVMLPRTNLMLEVVQGEVNAGIRTLLAPELSAELSVLELDKIKAGINFNF